MQEVRDTELLRQYARENSEEAFAALVTRHVNLVYSVALRKTGHPAAAEEITQAVFIVLAKKADALSRHVALTGWLYQAARLTAGNFLRTEIRRARREQEAYMQSLSDQTESEVWPQIMPLLEDAMGRLGEKDRNALALRFFEEKSFSEIGAAFGASENAAKKRVAYALEKLRAYFSKRGVSSPTAILAAAIAANSVQAAPAALIKTTTAVALAKGATASASTLTLIQGALKIMAWTKAKTAIVAGVVVVLATGTTLTTLVQIKKHQQQKQKQVQSQAGFIPLASWSFKGYAAPEDTFQSALWAMSKGDVKSYQACLTPDYQKHFTQGIEAAKVEAFQVVSNEIISDDEVVLHVLSSRLGSAKATMKKINNEWKIDDGPQPEQ